MATKKTATTKPVHVQFHLDGIVLTTQIPAESIEAATEQGRAMRLTDLIDLAGAEWIDGDIRLTGVYEA